MLRILRAAQLASLLAAASVQRASAQPPGPPGGGAGAPTSTSSHAASMLGDVAKTTAVGTDVRTKATFPVDTHIYGPFEAGFSSQQDDILKGLGCSSGSLGYVSGGIDTQTAEQMVAYQCSIALPRISGSSYISLIDECGGHTKDYHFHERLSCLYNGSAPGHSTQVGKLLNGQLLYGKWEATGVLPTLDACGAHFGRTPDSPSADVYHYHVQDKPPFTVGCLGPNDDGTLVTVAQCRAFYSGCDNKLVNVSTSTGTRQYDLWCPCFNSTTGSNVGPGAVSWYTGAAARGRVSVGGTLVLLWAALGRFGGAT